MALGDRSAFDASPRSRRRHRTGTANVKTLDNSGKDTDTRIGNPWTGVPGDVS